MTTAATDLWVRSRAREYLEALPPGILADDETARILSCLFVAVARLDAVGRNQIVGLRDLVRPADAPRDFLAHLGTVVGLTADTGIPGYLDETAWRRLLPFVAEIWRQKGLDYRPLLYALLGRPVFVGGWHELRHVLDVTAIPHFGIDAPDAATHAERTVTMHLPDVFGCYPGYTPAAGEVAADRDLVRAFLDRIRPVGQRLDVFWYDWVEDFSQGLFWWRTIFGGPLAVEDWVLTLPVSTACIHDPGPVRGQYRYAVWDVFLRLRPTAAGESVFLFRYNEATGAYFAVVLTCDPADPMNGAVRLEYFDGAVTFLIATINTGVPAEEWLYLHVSCDEESGIEAFQIHLDGDLLIDTTDVARPAVVGSVAFVTTANVQMDVQLVEQYQPPADYERIGPNP